MPTSIVIAAGGTGGHIYPGLALAEAIKTIEPQAKVSFVGTPRGLEKKLIPEAGYRLALVDMVPFSGSSRFTLPIALARSTLQCRKVLKAEHADVAVAMGGYAGVPLILAAKLAAVPSLIHESGAVAGKANLLAARLTPNVALAFDSASGPFANAQDLRIVGMPLRAGFAGFDRDALRNEGRAMFDVQPDQFLLLAMGGSQGAASINHAVVGLAGMWRSRPDFRAVIKAGPTHFEKVTAGLKDNGGDAVCTCVPFIDNIEMAYAAADLGLFRAGAGTIAELAVVGLPSILVPYPFAPADHQTLNAEVLSGKGAATIVKDHMLSAETLAEALIGLVEDRSQVEKMRANALGEAKPNAAFDLARWVLSLAPSSEQ
ncbi:MAG: glycosyltransferase [Actinomycetota bacterium]|nr:UDP-N-acetylglucosamine--N-acetylmuramyl-(pentapeptide) pyrophosphoryl-undecaprenol N-acetylglucosamine transferase [Actinomycetota bacterium]